MSAYDSSTGRAMPRPCRATPLALQLLELGQQIEMCVIFNHAVADAVLDAIIVDTAVCLFCVSTIVTPKAA